MQVLRVGTEGEDVLKWQHFLIGLGYSIGVADGSFGQKTKGATVTFQLKVGLPGDGVVGGSTYGHAMVLGFGDITDDVVDDESSPNWPPKSNLEPVSMATRVATFGKFSFVPAPIASNPEAIKITDDWPVKNIIMVTIPQLRGISGAPKSGSIQWHKSASKQLQELFSAWEKDGLMNLVRTWAGSYVPRFIRGSRTSLSNHAWGTAFDINAQWNSLGARPALTTEIGSVRRLVPRANELGFYWLGHSTGRPDGMHFEVCRIM